MYTLSLENSHFMYLQNLIYEKMQANAIKQVKKKRITKIYRSPVDPQLKAGIGSHYLQI